MCMNFCLYFLICFFWILINDRDVTNFGYVMQKNFSACLVYFLTVLKNTRTIWKNSYRFRKNESIYSEIKRNRFYDYFMKNNFFYKFVNNFLTLLLCKIYVLDICKIVYFFRFFMEILWKYCKKQKIYI